MTQNLVSLQLTSAVIAEVDAALATLERHFQPFVELSNDERRSLAKMGDKSEAFCRQTLTVLEQNTHILPAGFNLPEMHNDLASLDLLRPRFARLRQLTTRADDTEMALGSDVYCAALEGYAFARVAGKGAALDALRANASARFARSGKSRAANEDTGA